MSRPAPLGSGTAARLWHVVRAWPALQQVAFSGMVAYRAEMVIWVLSATLPLVMLALWSAAAADAPIGGWDQLGFTRYFAVNLIVRQLTGAWVVWELNWQIRQGELSPRLLRPMHPLVFNLAETLAALPFRALVLFPLVGVLAVWRPEALFLPSPSVGAAFLLSVAMAFFAAWSVQAAFGMLAFWFEQSMGFWSAWFAVWALCAGYFVPLDLFPAGWVQLVRALPFYSTLGAPIDILLGRVAIGPTLAVQAFWVVALGAGLGLMWRAGVRRYGAVGA